MPRGNIDMGMRVLHILNMAQLVVECLSLTRPTHDGAPFLPYGSTSKRFEAPQPDFLFPDLH